jgi:hypothetical protein
MRPIVVFAVALLAVGSGAALASVTPSTEPTGPTKVFDRTLVCKTRIGFVRVSAGAGSSAGEGGFSLNGDSSRGIFGPGGLPLANVVAVDPGPEAYRGVYVEMKNCARTTNKVPLTSNGLPAPVAFDVTAICPTGGRVLVRLRYTYVPGAHHRHFQAGGRMLSAQLAVRSYKTLKPVLFVNLTGGGTKLQFFSANACRRQA